MAERFLFFTRVGAGLINGRRRVCVCGFIFGGRGGIVPGCWGEGRPWMMLDVGGRGDGDGDGDVFGLLCCAVRRCLALPV